VRLLPTQSYLNEDDMADVIKTDPTVAQGQIQVVVCQVSYPLLAL
jgi:hypothetical protein